MTCHKKIICFLYTSAPSRVDITDVHAYQHMAYQMHYILINQQAWIEYEYNHTRFIVAHQTICLLYIDSMQIGAIQSNYTTKYSLNGT